MTDGTNPPSVAALLARVEHQSSVHEGAPQSGVADADAERRFVRIARLAQYVIGAGHDHHCCVTRIYELATGENV